MTLFPLLLQCNHMKTIKISEETYKRLLETKADFIKVHGVNFSMDDVVSDVLDIALER